MLIAACVSAVFCIVFVTLATKSWFATLATLGFCVFIIWSLFALAQLLINQLRQQTAHMQTLLDVIKSLK